MNSLRLRPPLAVEEAIAALDATNAPLTEHAVADAIRVAADDNPAATDMERLAGRVEVIAFNLVGNSDRNSEWGTHFGPMMTGHNGDGKPWQFPDVSEVDGNTVSYWAGRSHAVAHPVIAARYADAAWDLARLAKEKPDPDNARFASDTYCASATPRFRSELHERLTAGGRALTLATQINDAKRIATARELLMALHSEAATQKAGWWWIVPRRLFRDKRSGITEGERAELVHSLEELVAHYGDFSDPEKFDPHHLEDAADLLQIHYQRHGTRDDVRRLTETVARGFENAAAIAGPLVASSFLQKAVSGFRAAGMKDESDRARILMQDAVRASGAEMTAIGTEIKVSFDDMDKLMSQLIVDDPALTLALIAKYFLASRETLEKQLDELSGKAPLQFLMSLQIQQDDHVAATIGSLKEDLFGRLVHQTHQYFGFSEIWLVEALDRAIEKHDYGADYLTGWVNRHNLFDDTTFLYDGLATWLKGDYAASLHLLVPQVEKAFRAVAASLGEPVTKAHPATKNASVAIGLGDILSNEKVSEALGPDLSLHFRALYSDPRGMNLRNRVAHGTYRAESLGPHILRTVVHSLLVLGVWKELARGRR